MLPRAEPNSVNDMKEIAHFVFGGHATIIVICRGRYTTICMESRMVLELRRKT